MRQLRRHLHKKNGTFKCLLVPFRSCNPDGRANNFNGNWNWMLGSLQVQTCSSSLVVLSDLFLFAVGRDIIFLRTGSFFCCFFFGLCLCFCLAIHSRIRILHIVLVSSMCCGSRGCSEAGDGGILPVESNSTYFAYLKNRTYAFCN